MEHTWLGGTRGVPITRSNSALRISEHSGSAPKRRTPSGCRMRPDVALRSRSNFDEQVNRHTAVRMCARGPARVGRRPTQTLRSSAMNARSNPHPIWPAACAVLTAALLLTAAQPAAAQPGWVLSHQKISATEGGFTGILNNGDWFGGSAAALGDLDGDGVTDLAVGAPLDDGGGVFRGAVWVLFLNT
ncbi:MAG TPA: hypothetical protein ENH78_09755, partial [Phycisphaerae bacterium]|nr:hypothetical protein [Phycisphaerae bacterium]